MNIRRFEDKDYVPYCILYTDWNLPLSKKSWISDDTYVVEKDNAIICGGSLYQLGRTPMFWIEGIVSNKNVDKEIRKEGLDLLIDRLFTEAKTQGADIVMSSTPRDGLKSIFQKHEFNETPEKYFHLGRVK